MALVLASLMAFAACAANNSEETTTTQLAIEDGLTVDIETTGVTVKDVPMDTKKITIGEKEYECPALISDFIDDSWYFDENAIEKMNLEYNGEIEANTTTELLDMNLYHDEYGFRMMMLEAKNDSEEVQLLRDCYLTKIGINRSMMEDPEKVNIILPGGITWQSTAADVLSVYGTEEEHPNFRQVDLNGSTADYIGETFSVSFTFFEDGTIEYICFY